MMTGDAFIDFAAKLAARATTNEAEQRSAISRAYYGSYHLAKSFLEYLGIVVQERNHDFVKNCLLSCVNEDARQAGERLGDLRTERNRADYDLKRRWPVAGGDPQQSLRKWIESAKSVQNLLAVCAAEPVCAEVKAEVQEFVERQRRVRSAGRGADPATD